MNWTRTDPGAGDPAGIRHAATLRQAQATELEDRTRRPLVIATDHALSDGWKARSATAFVASTVDLIAAIDPIIAGLKSEADTLMRYAAQVETIHSESIALRHQIVNAHADFDLVKLARDGTLYDFVFPPTPSVLISLEYQSLSSRMEAQTHSIASLNTRWDVLDDQRRRADHACASSISGSRTVSAARLHPATSSVDSKMSLLTLLGGLSIHGLAGLMRNDPQLMQEFWRNPPHPGSVAIWWSGLGAAEHTQLIAGCAGIVGNLPGVDVDSRMEANMGEFERAHRGYDSLTPVQQSAVDDVSHALALGSAATPHGLLNFNLDAVPPSAAVVVGDLAAASATGGVSMVVPEMDSRVGEGDSMHTATLAAGNVLREQDVVDPHNVHAVVAWTGYGSPSADLLPFDASAPGSVVDNPTATVGAERFAGELDGQFAQAKAFGLNPHPSTAVLGHTSMTTMVTDALARTEHSVAAVVFADSPEGTGMPFASSSPGGHPFPPPVNGTSW